MMVVITKHLAQSRPRECSALDPLSDWQTRDVLGLSWGNILCLLHSQTRRRTRAWTRPTLSVSKCTQIDL